MGDWGPNVKKNERTGTGIYQHIHKEKVQNERGVKSAQHPVIILGQSMSKLEGTIRYRHNTTMCGLMCESYNQ